jgi:hypothetical protein
LASFGAGICAVDSEASGLRLVVGRTSSWISRNKDGLVAIASLPARLVV